MVDTRYRLPLIALWCCLAFTLIHTVLTFLSYFTAPLALVSDYDPSSMTQEDLMSIARSFGKVLWREAVWTGVGAIALLAIAVWMQVVSATKTS
jgi:hypothetical protein